MSIYRIFCETEGIFKYSKNKTIPTQCPANPSHVVNSDSVVDLGMTSIVPLLKTATNSSIFLNGSMVKSQKTPTTYSDQNKILTVAEFSTGIIIYNGSTDSNLTLPNIIDITNDLNTFLAVQNDSAYDFSVINMSQNNITMNMGTGGSIIGNNTIQPNQSGLFRLRYVDSNSYVIYRL